ncbi:metallophosphoesterase [Candidatus Enterococcus ikei]|uniref:Metallophosphoesterase n=1 Tax=Candidatus Enterococcus ikei TaxID=2815326 RepID=A0ABS3GWT7_9ENTE|nr:metallophosphoesterase [Enterococcus sp. DIV0869a]MBO0439702.1 metallophosphoesterase [Enterococcus sp. DIV0869a]
MKFCNRKVFLRNTLLFIASAVSLFLLFLPTNVSAAEYSVDLNTNLKIEKNDGSGEVLQYADGKMSWGKWSGDKSQIWHSEKMWAGEEYQLKPAHEDKNHYLFWDKDIWNPNDKGKLSFGQILTKNQTTSKWLIEANSDGTYSIRNSHAPNPGLAVAADGVGLSFGGASAFKLSNDLTPPTSENHAIVFTSDPQYPWTDKMDRGESDPDAEANSAALIREQYTSVNAYNDTKSSAKVVINGDITAFGHSWQWDKMENELMPILNKKYYFGLGNHDIENNQGKCFEDSCFDLSLERLTYHISTNNVLSADAGGIRSYAYSVQLPGNVMLLQLNNYPTMDYQATSWSGPLNVGVKPNFGFIENALGYAKNNGMKVLIGVHKPDDWKGGPSAQFIQLIEKYNVKAVFAGHYHDKVGKYSSPDYFGNVPVFLSGGATQKSFLITEYDDQSLKIYKVQNNAWQNKEFIYEINLKN